MIEKKNHLQEENVLSLRSEVVKRSRELLFAMKEQGLPYQEMMVAIEKIQIQSLPHKQHIKEVRSINSTYTEKYNLTT